MYSTIPYINNDILQITIITLKLLSITGSTSGSSKY